MNRVLLLLTIALLATGCRKPQPSPDFIIASGRYTNLIAVNGDDAYPTAEMDAVVEQLGLVKEKSSDFTAARTLIDSIGRERARIAAARVANAKAAAAPVAAPTFPALTRPPPEPEPAPVAPPPAVEDPLAMVPGATWAPIEKKFAGCIVSSGTVTLTAPDGGNMRQTEGFSLAPSADCAKKVPTLVENVAIVFEGKILLIGPKSSVVTTSLPAAPAPTPAPPAPATPTAPIAPPQDPVLTPIKY